MRKLKYGKDEIWTQSHSRQKNSIYTNDIPVYFTHVYTYMLEPIPLWEHVIYYLKGV